MTQNGMESEYATRSGLDTIYLRPELHDLKVIGVEEHAAFPGIISSLPDTEAVLHAKSMYQPIMKYPLFDYAHPRVTNMDEKRIADMDEGGIAMQIISFAGGLTASHAGGETGKEIASAINDEIAKAVKKRPKRFAAFAELPLQEPDAAVEELRRCVKDYGFVGSMLSGSIDGVGEYYDSPRFDKLLSAFEELDVPLFLHPGIAPKPVVDTYYTFPHDPRLTSLFAGPGWGWHNEVAIHVLRLVLSGTLERHPKLKIIAGHQGEMMPMMLQRFDEMFDAKILGLKRTVAETLRSQVWIAISGFFTLPPTIAAIHTWGVDRVLFANDYPYIDTQRVPKFLSALSDAISPSDMRKICQTNAEDLFKIKA